MAFCIVHHPTDNFSAVAWQGELSFENVKDALAELEKGPTGSLVLWDFTGVTQVTITTDHIHSLAAMSRRQSSQRGPATKTAAVVPSNFLFGLARQAQAFALATAANPPAEIFRTRRPALEWLGLSESAIGNLV